MSKLIVSGSAVLAGATCKRGLCFWDTHRRVLGALAPSSVRCGLDYFSAVQVHFLISSPCSLLGKDQLCHIFKVTMYLYPLVCIRFCVSVVDSKALVIEKKKSQYILIEEPGTPISLFVWKFWENGEGVRGGCLLWYCFQAILFRLMLKNRVAHWKLKVFFDYPTCVLPRWMTLVTVSWVQDKVPVLFMVVAAALLLPPSYKGQRVEWWRGGRSDKFTFLNRPFWCKDISSKLRCIDLACGVRIS